jgi:hypothetical protein
LKLPGWSYDLPAGVFRLIGAAFSGSDPSEPASMITSKSASEGTPATTPSICSYAGLAAAKSSCACLTKAATSLRFSRSSFA